MLILLITISCSNDDIVNLDNKTNQVTSLTDYEYADLLFLREEEKLARDVYLFSYEKYKFEIFKNISNSEQQHMNSVLQLLNKYNIQDPISVEIGVFNNQTLQNMYNQLVAKSSISLLDALIVGNQIEDLDINDLTLNELRTNKLDLLSVYSSLKCGSKNHLRSFYSQLLQQGGLYNPEYISQGSFNSIVSTPTEKCNSN
jgi:hypothetical protein